jgi:hypothetical protein
VWKDRRFFLDPETFFYVLFALTLTLILFTHPFLKYPYDMFTHLQKIDEQSIATSWPEKRVVWHYLWAQLFDLIHIERSEIFLRAKIIHYTQSISIFLMIYYSSKVFIKNLFNPISSTTLKYIAYWATVIWFSVFANASVNHMQVWILWYSINYQITLPMTILALALTVSVIFETNSKKTKSIKTLLILLLIYMVLRMHAMEFVYYVMYIGVLTILFLDKILQWCRKHLYLSFTIFLVLIYMSRWVIEYIKSHVYRTSPLFNYLSLKKLPQLIQKVYEEGEIVTTYYNKTAYIFNELLYISLMAILLLLAFAIFRYCKKYQDIVNLRLLLFFFITSLFIFIPVFIPSAGLASLLTYATISYRFYYSSLLFLALPSFIFYLYYLLKIKNIWIINLTLLLLISGCFLYSRYDIKNHQNYYRNIMSIKNAFDKKKMGFNLSKKHIETIGRKLEYYEKQNKSDKPNFYYARDDVAFVIKFVYQKPVFYGRRGTVNYIKSYHEHQDIDYVPVLFEVPENFPEYRRFQ